jgi:hypothetical protein
VGLSGCEVAQHERTIVPDGRRAPLTWRDQIGPGKCSAGDFSRPSGPTKRYNEKDIGSP